MISPTSICCGEAHVTLIRTTTNDVCFETQLLNSEQIQYMVSAIKSLQVRRWGRDLTLVWFMVVLLEQHLEQPRRKMLHATTERYYEMISPPTTPACQGQIIAVKSSADDRINILRQGQPACSNSGQHIFLFKSKFYRHLERGAFLGPTPWLQWIHRCRTVHGNTKRQ